jgi:hypothetical protein
MRSHSINIEVRDCGGCSSSIPASYPKLPAIVKKPTDGRPWAWVRRVVDGAEF